MILNFSFKINDTLSFMFHHQDFTTTITSSWTQSLNCISHFFASWCILTFLLYFIFTCFQSFWSFIPKLEFKFICFAFHCQCLLHGVVVALLCRLSLTYFPCSIVLCVIIFSSKTTTSRTMIFVVELCYASLGFQCQFFFGHFK